MYVKIVRRCFERIRNDDEAPILRANCNGSSSSLHVSLVLVVLYYVVCLDLGFGDVRGPTALDVVLLCETLFDSEPRLE